METTKKELSDIKFELTFKLDSTDLIPYLNQAATHLSKHTNIPGFRPGKAPLGIVEKHLGKDTVFGEALDYAVNGSINNYFKENQTDVLEDSDFKLLENTPGNLRFQITITTWPQVTLGQWPSKKISRKKLEVTEEEVEKAAKELTKMLTSELVVEREIKKEDKAIIDFDVIVDGSVIEGGTGREFGVEIGEGTMIPGFEDNLIGHKAGDEFEFKLNFPQNYAAHLAGKEALFKIKVTQVLQRMAPVVDDALAKRIGEESAASLKSKLKENLLAEKERDEEQRLEIESIKTITQAAKIGTIAPKIIDSELEKMIGEFEHDLSHQGISLEQHLKLTNKTLDDIKKDLKPKAEERIRTSLVIRQLADENEIFVDEKELEQELQMHLQHHAKNPEALKDIQDPGYARYLASRLLNRKVIQFLKEKLVEQK